ncbi:MAG: beta-lactamase family protein [Clostridia bacterium]|nr:beta-lactamase family protein [Clostridia bacterium]
MHQFLQDMAKFCLDIGANIYFIGVVTDGGFDAQRIAVRETNNCSNIYSVSKAFTVTAVGLLADRGLLSTEEKVCDILGELCPAEMDPRWRQTTVDMVLRHQIGLPRNFLDIDSRDPLTFGEDYLRHMLTEPLICDPGTEGIYTDAAYYLLSRLVELRAGRNMDDLLREHIYRPLAFREVAYSRCPQGHAMGATGMYIRADDMAKLGALYLHGGDWLGSRILSQDWVDTVLERGYEFKPKGDFGAYGKGGMYGQMLMVIPEKNRVVAWQGFNRSPVAGELVRFAIAY